jgi:pimeloyl-ACP methyl ester carboxylesterase
MTTTLDLRQRLLAGLPLSDTRMELAGVPTAVLAGGSGPPMVLLHSCAEFAALWLRVLPGLLRTHRVIVPDLPGHGASQPVGSLPPGQVLRWLDRLIKQCAPEPPVVVARGLGGAIAARLACRRPYRFAQLVLVDSFGLAELAPAPGFAAALHAFVADPAEHTRDQLFAQCFADVDRLRTQFGPQWTDVGDYALDRARTPGWRATMDAMLPEFVHPAIPPTELAGLTVPTALIWGRYDLQVLVSVAQTASARHGWPLRVIDDAGDDPSLEQPDAFLDALREVLR